MPVTYFYAVLFASLVFGLFAAVAAGRIYVRMGLHAKMGQLWERICSAWQERRSA